MKTSYPHPQDITNHDQDLLQFISLTDSEKWETVINMIDPGGFSAQHFYLEVLKAFCRNRIDYLVTGDLATALYGHIEYQPPLEIWLEISAINLEKLKSTMIFLGFDKNLMDAMWKERSLNQAEPIQFCDNENVFFLNLITAKSLHNSTWNACQSRSQWFQISREINIPLMAIDDLIFFQEGVSRAEGNEKARRTIKGLKEIKQLKEE